MSFLTELEKYTSWDYRDSFASKLREDNFFDEEQYNKLCALIKKIALENKWKKEIDRKIVWELAHLYRIMTILFCSYQKKEIKPVNFDLDFFYDKLEELWWLIFNFFNDTVWWND